MEQLHIAPAHRLNGAVHIQCAKNSVLPILAASILAADCCLIEDCPRLRDVDASVRILRHLGAKCEWQDEGLAVDTTTLCCAAVPDELMREMRSSIIFLGAILARLGEATLSYPGGCELGPRPIDLHLASLRTLGAEINETGGRLSCTGALRAGEITLAIPSVGATENSILAACGAEGTTVIYNAAREPEIVDLQDFLNKMGGCVRGAGTSIITVEGKRRLHGCRHRCIGDRIVAATYLCAVAAVGGKASFTGVDYRTVSTVALSLSESGCKVESRGEEVHIESSGLLRSVRPVRTAPYPGFPTDAQSVLMAALLRAKGSTVFVENIFDSRYRQVDEFARMGADVRVAGKVAVVSGVERLHGASVRCSDLRGGAALAVAGLQAEGETQLSDVHHIDRGYVSIEHDLRALGARIWREK